MGEDEHCAEDVQASKDVDKLPLKDVGDRPLMEYFWEDTKATASIGIPLCIGGASKMLQVMITSVMLGRKDTILQAAITVSGMWTCWADTLVTAGDGQIGTLCSHAFGAGNFHLVGTWLQLGLLWLTVLYPPFALLRIGTGPMLECFGVDASLAEPAGIFAVWSAPGVIFELWYMAVHIYCVSQGIMKPDAAISVVFIGVACVLVWLGAIYFDLGAVGVALAFSLSGFLRLASLVLYCVWKDKFKQTWGGWNLKEVLQPVRWKIFLPMAMPAMAGGVAETLHMTISAVIAARLGHKTSVALDLCMKLYILTCMMVSAVCGGSGMMMSRSLGEGRPKRAAEVVKVGLVLTYGSLVTASIVLWSVFPFYARLVSPEKDVQELIIKARLPCALNLTFCGGIMLIAEILMKQGRPQIVAICLPLCNWFIGLPISVALAPIWGISGILYGSLTAYGLSHVVLLWYVYTSDWGALSLEARRIAGVETALEDLEREIS